MDEISPDSIEQLKTKLHGNMFKCLSCGTALTSVLIAEGFKGIDGGPACVGCRNGDSKPGDSKVEDREQAYWLLRDAAEDIIDLQLGTFMFHKDALDIEDDPFAKYVLSMLGDALEKAKELDP